MLRKASTKSIARRAMSQFEESRATPTTTPRTVASRMATSTTRIVDQTPTMYIVNRELVTPSTSISHWLPTAKPAGSLRKTEAELAQVERGEHVREHDRGRGDVGALGEQPPKSAPINDRHMTTGEAGVGGHVQRFIARVRAGPTARLMVETQEGLHPRGDPSCVRCRPQWL